MPNRTDANTDPDADRPVMPATQPAEPRRIVLDIETIAEAGDIQTEWVPIPEWAPLDAENKEDYGVFVRSLNGRERAQWQTDITAGTGENVTVNYHKMAVMMVIYAAVDEKGKKLYKLSDERVLLKKNSKILERIANAAQVLSGIGDDEMKALAGNSNASPEDEELTY